MNSAVANPSMLTEQITYVSKPLKNIDEIKMAQQLIYKVYIEEMGWQPDTNNPSRIEFVDWYEQYLLVDAFDCIASWFGTFNHEKLVACWRFCRPRNQQFELELYHPIPDFLKVAKTLEVNRLAIDSAYRNKSRVIFELVRASYQNLYQDYDYSFAAVAFPYPGNLYLKLGAKKADFPSFKYSSADQSAVSLIYFNFKDTRSTLKYTT